MRKHSILRLAALLVLAIGHTVLSATITQSQLDAVTNKTLTLPAGTFSIGSTLNVHTGTTIIGDPAGGTHLSFTLPSPGYGFAIDGNASNVTLTQLDVTSNYGLIAMKNGSAYNSIHLTRNRFQYGGGTLPDGTLVFGISATIGGNDFQITHNYFHDSPNSVRNWCIFGYTNSNFDYNTFYNITDGGQWEYMGANCSFDYNYATKLHRMMQETAGSASTVNFKVIGNVAHDYVLPYNDTEGVSICIYGTNTQIENNYFDANIAPGSSWGQQSGEQAGQAPRFGYGIEASGSPGTVSGNTLIGPWAEDVSVMGVETITGNKVFGNALWSEFATEPSPAGVTPSITQSNNSTDANVADAPQPPVNTNTYLGSAVATTPIIVITPPPAATPATNTITVTASPTASAVTLSWPEQLSNISIVTATPTDPCGTVTESGPAAGAMLTNLNAGWGYSSTVSGALNGVSYSGIAKYSTTGKSADGTKAIIAKLAPTLLYQQTVLTNFYSDGSSVVVSTTTQPAK